MRDKLMVAALLFANQLWKTHLVLKDLMLDEAPRKAFS
jgi:hypothetical protein